ncbi:MAG: hypothetical protein U9Q22_00010 [Candidatus Altiarchaeota archaeon]|nr:hypothetical protein [Candidatus Altiarchaeota archaeon]
MKLLLTGVILLSLTTVVVAELGGTEIRFDEFLKSIADTIGKSLTEFVRRVIYTFMVTNRINELRDITQDNIAGFLVDDPPIDAAPIRGFINFFIIILEPVYIMALITTGLYLIFFSGSARGRASAKSMFLSLVIGVVLISLSVEIVKLLLQVSNALTSEILAQYSGDLTAMHKATIDYFKTHMMRLMILDIAASIPFMLLAITTAVGIFGVLVIRYLMVILLAMVFPVAVFLSIFYPTRRMGRMLLTQLFFWVFLPVGYAIALVVTAVGGDAILVNIPEIADIVNISGTLFLIASPLIIFGLMNWFSAFYLSMVLIQPLASLAGLLGVVEIKSGGEEGIEEEEEEEERVEEPTAAVGLHGYAAVPEEGHLPEEEIKPTLQDMADMRGEILLEEIQKNKRLYNSLIHGAEKRGMSLEEFVRERYGFRVVSGKAGAGYIKPRISGTADKGKVRPSMRSKIPSRLSRAVPGKRAMLTVTLPSGGESPLLVVNVLPGETGRVEIAVRNEGNSILSKVVIFDEDLLSKGIMITYGKNRFRLGRGEEKIIPLVINPKRDMGKKLCVGSIIIKAEEGPQNMVDVYVDTRKKKREEFGEKYVKRFSPKTTG